MDCFDDKTEVEGWKAALEEHGKCIQMFRRTHSNRTRTEFLALD
ncbi:transcriptional regulator [Bacillus thuringiensis]|nr:transcriptional regulator [Bacillus thuringiensis]